MITYDELEQLKNIKHGLVKDLIEYGKKDGKLNEVDTLAHAIKNMCKIIEDGEMEAEGGYSMRGRSGASGRGGNSGAYAGYSMAPMMMNPGYSMNYGSSGAYMMPMDYSMAQGGGSGAQGGGNSGARGRYSSHGDLVSELYSVMNSAQNDSERQEIQNLINRMQNR